MVDYIVIKIVGLAWTILAVFLAVIGGSKSSRNEKFSGNLMMASLCLFPVAITFAERSASGGDGVFLWGFPLTGETGFVLVGVGLAVHLLGILTLKKQWSSSVTLSSEPKLITHGVYRFIRNPIYAGILLTLVGFGLTLANWISFLMLVLPNACSFGYRIFVEENFLKVNFGQDYELYCRKTKRIVPFVF